MKVTREAEDFRFLKDAIVTKNMEANVKNNQLVLNINKKEMCLKQVETYSIPVAMRCEDGCNLVGNNGSTYFTQLKFKGKIKLFKNEKLPTVIPSASNFSSLKDVISPVSGNVLGKGYTNEAIGLSILQTIDKPWDVNKFYVSFGENLVTIGRHSQMNYATGPSMILTVPEGKRVIFEMVANSTMTTTNAGRPMRIYKVKDNDEIGDLVFQQTFNGTHKTKFETNLESGSYYIRQQASTNYYSFRITYHNGGKTTIKANFENLYNPPEHKTGIYKFNPDLTLSLIACSNYNDEYDQALTTVNQNYIDGDSTYYMSVFVKQDARMLGMKCEIENQIDPWLAFKLPRDAGEKTDFGNHTHPMETFSAGIETIEFD